MGTMAGWYAARRPNMSSKVVIALALLAFALVAAVPIAFVAGVILMLLGHVIGGLALFGGSILAAPAQAFIERPGPADVGDTERNDADALLHASNLADATDINAARGSPDVGVVVPV